MMCLICHMPSRLDKNTMRRNVWNKVEGNQTKLLPFIYFVKDISHLHHASYHEILCIV